MLESKFICVSKMGANQADSYYDALIWFDNVRHAVD